MKRSLMYVGIAVSTWMNLVVVVIDLGLRNYHGAALQSIVVAAGGAWFWTMPKADVWLDARIGEATAQRRLAELALEAMEQMKRTGDLRVNAIVEPAPRVN